MIVADGVTPAVRTIVDAIGPNEEHVTVSDLATRLGVSKQTAAYRIGRAIGGGLLVNDESARGDPPSSAGGWPFRRSGKRSPRPSSLRSGQTVKIASGRKERPPARTPAATGTAEARTTTG
jgi:hypothetical protein